MSDNPFSIFDFLGYFFPGATVLIALYHYMPAVNKMLSIKDNTSAMVYAICIIAAYVLGHFVALLSSITVEKYVKWKYGYPSQYLLKNYTRKSYFQTEPMKNSSIGTKQQKRYRLGKTIIKILVLILIAPISILDAILSRWLAIDYYYTRRLPDQQISMIRAKCTNLFRKLNIYSPNKTVFQDDFHRIVHNYYYEKALGHTKRMENCIAIYDFLRAMSLVFVILFYVVFYKGIRMLFVASSIDKASIFFIVSYAILSYVCYMGFMKFYRKFTVENFMCLICDTDLDINESGVQNDNPTVFGSLQRNGNNLTIK